MARITMSKQAAQKAIDYSTEAHEKLLANANLMNEKVNVRFIGLKDPSYVSYLELAIQMQELIGQGGRKMEAISDYSQKIINWIDTYNEG